ncbi:MAG: Crp/Fnr family transcriptional regulator [Bradymonadaceae bacterium]
MDTEETYSLDLLQRFDVFEGLEPSDLERVHDEVDLRCYPAGEPLIVEGETNRALFAVLDGRVEILKNDKSGTAQRLAVLDAETILGEHGFVLAEPRTATVRALDDVDALCLHGEAFDRLDAAGGDAARTIEHNILRMLAHRQQSINDKLLALREESETETGYHCDETNDIGDQLMSRWTV